MSVRVTAVDRPEVPSCLLSDRFRHEVTYFVTSSSDMGVPPQRGQYFVRLADSKVALEDGVIRLVSPLDSGNTAEIELTEELEDWLTWMVQHQVEHIQLT